VSTAPRVLGAPIDRVDGSLKVTGAARYAYEHPVDAVAYAVGVQSTIARGRIVSVDATAAEALDGVVGVLWHENAPRLQTDDAELAVLQSAAVAFSGQFARSSSPARRRWPGTPRRWWRSATRRSPTTCC
jgi:xanthine dehydrogenase YagR molybdenum-binding subunit